MTPPTPTDLPGTSTAPRGVASPATEAGSDDLTRWQRLPKVLLHEHLDGGLRPATLLALLRRRGLASPAATEAELADWFRARAQAGSLTEYLRGFELTVAAMADEAALEQVAFEAAEDARTDGCLMAEFRIAPLLFEPLGLPPEVVVAALWAGLQRSPLPSGLILCAMRQDSAASSLRVAALVARLQHAGVVGFDLAGPELGFPPSRHAAALAALREQGLPITCHAGEADGGERVLEAARLGAVRIGHGVRLAASLAGPAGPALRDELIERGVHLEVCVTSNLHTGAVPDLASHPIGRLREAGLSVSFHTDNRLISMTRLSEEARLLHDRLGFSEAALRDMGLAAARASFLPAAWRALATNKFVSDVAFHSRTP
jgi:adenosine deaminase